MPGRCPNASVGLGQGQSLFPHQTSTGWARALVHLNCSLITGSWPLLQLGSDNLMMTWLMSASTCQVSGSFSGLGPRAQQFRLCLLQLQTARSGGQHRSPRQKRCNNRNYASVPAFSTRRGSVLLRPRKGRGQSRLRRMWSGLLLVTSARPVSCSGSICACMLRRLMDFSAQHATSQSQNRARPAIGSTPA